MIVSWPIDVGGSVPGIRDGDRAISFFDVERIRADPFKKRTAEI
jgi:hypothetical protein